MAEYEHCIKEEHMGEILEATAQDVDFQYNDPFDSDLPPGILLAMQLEAMGAWLDSRDALYVMKNLFVFFCVCGFEQFLFTRFIPFSGINILIKCKCNENVFKFSLIE